MIWGLFKKKSDSVVSESAVEPVASVGTDSVAPEVPDVVTAPETDAQKNVGLFGRLFDGLKKSSAKLADGVAGVFTRKKLDQETLDELEELLIRSDMGAAAAHKITAGLAKDRFDKEISAPEVRAALADEIADILKPREAALDLTNGPRPRIVLMVGVNGSGKTTTIGKLCALLSQHGAKVVVGAGDTFRAAAVEQLAMWAGRLGAEIVRGEPGCDPASVAHRAVAKAVEGGFDVCIIDTAGRLQTQANLMQELGKIRRVIAKQIPDAPHETLLVIDATAGQNALSQAKGFKEAAGCTGIVLSKLDGSARGGVIVPVAEQFGLPVKFVGVGESADDLEPFRPEEFLAALLEGSFAPAG
jgi:fused signal recognition particle receptor